MSEQKLEMKTTIDEQMHRRFPNMDLTIEADGLSLGLKNQLVVSSDIALIVAFIKTHPEIIKLDLSNNHIDDSEGVAFLKDLALSHLNISGNIIMEAGTAALAANRYLLHLDA